MAWSYFIDLQQRTVFLRFSGVVTPEDVREEMAALKADPNFDPKFNQLMDSSAAKPAPDFPVEKIREFGTMSLFDKSSRRAIAVSGDLAFGLARMFATYREIHGEMNLQVFRNRDEALAWLGVTEPLALQEKKADSSST